MDDHRSHLREYLTEHIRRMAIEEPSGPSGPFAAMVKTALPKDASFVRIPKASGLMRGYFAWLRLHYPADVDREIREWCNELHVPDEQSLLASFAEAESPHGQGPVRPRED
jgi:hypothetical protein